MSKSLDLDAADMLALGRLTTRAVTGVTGIVEDVHSQVAFPSVGPWQPRSGGIPALVYSSIRAVTGLVDTSLAVASAEGYASKKRRVSAGREALMAVLNGVLGDYLVESNNPLAITMSLRQRGRAFAIDRKALRAKFPNATGKLLLLVHGLCMNDLQWKRQRHDHGAALSSDLGYTQLYLHYNSGLHVSENGRLLATLLENLANEWPVAIDEFAILGHSMGGLVARSAYYYGAQGGHRWPRQLRKLLFLGTPHHGVPLERLGNFIDTALQISPYSAPFARLGKIRSGGVTDMRYGNVVDADWKGRDRFAPSRDGRAPSPLPAKVESYAIAATTPKSPANSVAEFLGDGLVPVDSALGRHRDPAMSLGIGDSHAWIAHETNHWDLLSRRAVYDTIRRWFGSSPESA
jgi:pimeloyl-ACP methyl ester carboxylesterase